MRKIYNIFAKFEALSEAIWQSKLYQHLLFAAAAFISISVIGYHFGTFDQASHIPFLKKAIDPSLYPNDRFFDLRFTHYSYFWFLFIPFAKIGVLEVAMFIVHILATYLTFWALWSLSKTLFNNPLTSFLSIIIFIIPHLSFGGTPLIEFSLLNRTFVLPFLLIAINLYLKNRIILALFLLGLMYNFHVISVNFILFMFLFDLVLNIKTTRWKEIILGLILFIAGALPVLLWKFGNSSLDLSVRQEWFSIIDKSILHFMFSIFTADPAIILLTLSGISVILMFFIAKKYIPSSKYTIKINHFVMSLLLILMIEFITSQWLPVTIIIQSQILRASLFLSIFSYLFFTYYVVASFQSKKLSSDQFMLLLTALFFSISPFIVIVVWFLLKLLNSKLGLRVAFLVLVGLFLSMMTVVTAINLWRPEINIFAPKNYNYDTQIWARENTAKDSVFITPPEMWGFYNLEWRVISERSSVVTLSELLEAAFAPDYIKIWKPRFDELAPGALDKFKGNFFDNVNITAKAYYSLSENDFKRISKKYNASYLVVEKPHAYNFSKIYENKGYIIYSLK